MHRSAILPALAIMAREHKEFLTGNAHLKWQPVTEIASTTVI